MSDPARSGFRPQTRFDGALDELAAAMRDGGLPRLADEAAAIRERARADLAADFDTRGSVACSAPPTRSHAHPHIHPHARAHPPTRARTHTHTHARTCTHARSPGRDRPGG